MAATVNGKHEAWRHRIQAQQTSGRSVRAWCREKGLHEHTFYWWRSRLELSPGATSQPHPQPRAEAVPFAEVRIDPVLAEPILLRLGGGRELVLPASMPMTQLAQMVRAIEGAS